MPLTNSGVLTHSYYASYDSGHDDGFTSGVQLKAIGNSQAAGLWLKTEGCVEDVNAANFSPFDLGAIPSTRSMGQLSPFTPCLTPGLSCGSSAASSPRLHADFESSFHDETLHKFNPSRRASIDGCTSRSSPFFSTSPLLPGRSATSPSLTSANASSASPTLQPRHPAFTRIAPQPQLSDVPPKKRARRTTKSTSESSHSGFQSSPSFSVVAIPAAQASDLVFNTSSKLSTKGAQPAKAKPSRSSRRGKSENRPSSPQPVKFRFVSVQHSAQSGGGSSAAVGDDEDGRVQFEEHMDEEADEGPFEHGPTELPPRPYPGGEYATSPLRLKKVVGKIPASNLDFLPVLEARFIRLENAIDRFVEIRAQKALQNSILPSRCTSAEPPPSLRTNPVRQKITPSRTTRKTA